MAERLARAALGYIRMIEGFNFYDIIVSLKASSVPDTIEAYRKISRSCSYPLHLGLTATGFPLAGAVKSSVAIGALLLEGIGDTIRVSLTDRSEEEIKVARYILESLDLRYFGPVVISCPTCGRCEVDLVKAVKELEKKSANSGLSDLPIKIAVMGCVVNGPGEAREADLGIAFGKKEGLLFKNGKPFKKAAFRDCIPVLLNELKKLKKN
jgi:(E)-4-hydroxy-3-methylbut-2-enyl-diphosphate synthase